MKTIQEIVKIINNGKSEDAKLELEKLININKDNFLAHYFLGVVYAKLRNFDKAINCLNLSIKINPKNKNAFFELGALYKQQNNMNESKNNFIKALNLDHNFIEAYLYLANINESENNLLEANKIYQKALSINNGHFQLNKYYANFLMKIGELGKGLALRYKYSGVIRFNEDNLKIL